MQHLTISAPGMDANPMFVMMLLRALGTKVRDIAEALSKKAPLIDVMLVDPPVAAQITRIRQLLLVLERAAARPLIMLDGREIPLHTLNEDLDAAEKMLTRLTSPAGQNG